MSTKLLIYFAVSLFYTLITVWLLRWKNLTRIAAMKWSTGWKAGIEVFGYLLIGIMILDEVGLLLQEWNLPARIFGIFRAFEGLPFVSKLTYVANLSLVVPATYVLTKKLTEGARDENASRIASWPKFEDYCDRKALCLASIVLSISLMLLFLQCWVWNEWSADENINSMQLILSALTVILPSLALFSALKAMEINAKISSPYRNTRWFTKYDLVITAIVFFLSLTQTMVTRVILVLGLVNLVRRSRRKKEGTDFIGFEAVVSRISTFSDWDWWNLFFLLSSFFPILLILQAHAGPYPPAGSAFPKTETISFLYCCYMILFFVTAKKGPLKPVLSIFWNLFTVFALYGSILLISSWYMPALDPPGFSVVGDLSLFVFAGSPVVAAIGALIFHLIVALVFMSQLFVSRLGEQLLLGRGFSRRLVVNYLAWESLPFATALSVIWLVICLFFNSLVFSLTYLFLPAIFAFLSVGVASIFSFLIQSQVLRAARSLNDIASQKNDIMIFSKVIAENGFLALSRKWAQSARVKWRWGRLTAVTFGMGTILFFTLWLPQLSIQTHLQKLWSCQFEEIPLNKTFQLAGDNILAGTGEGGGIACYERKSGKKKWIVEDACNHILIPDSALMIVMKSLSTRSDPGKKVDRKQICALALESGKEIWQIQLGPDYDSSTDIRDVCQLVSGRLVIVDGGKVSVIDTPSGKIVSSFDASSSCRLELRGASLLWFDSRDNLMKSSDFREPVKLCSLDDSPRALFRVDSLLLVSSKSRLRLLDTCGLPRWTAENQYGQIYQTSMIKRKLLLATDSGLVALDQSTGNEIWGKKNLGNLQGKTMLHDELIWMGDQLFAADDKGKDDSLNRDAVLVGLTNGITEDNLLLGPRNNRTWKLSQFVVLADLAYVQVFWQETGELAFSDPYKLVATSSVKLNSADSVSRHTVSKLRPRGFAISGDTLWWGNAFGIYCAVAEEGTLSRKD